MFLAKLQMFHKPWFPWNKRFPLLNHHLEWGRVKSRYIIWPDVFIYHGLNTHVVFLLGDRHAQPLSELVVNYICKPKKGKWWPPPDEEPSMYYTNLYAYMEYIHVVICISFLAWSYYLYNLYYIITHNCAYRHPLDYKYTGFPSQKISLGFWESGLGRRICYLRYRRGQRWTIDGHIGHSSHAFAFTGGWFWKFCNLEVVDDTFIYIYIHTKIQGNGHRTGSVYHYYIALVH